jgi:hypothetical protein
MPPPISASPIMPRPAPLPATRDVDELKSLLARHSSLTPVEERVLVDAFEAARGGRSSGYEVMLLPDRKADALKQLKSVELFKDLPADVQARLAPVLDEVKIGRFVPSVQMHRPWKLTLGMHRPLVQIAYDTVKSWNTMIKDLSQTRPEFAELKLKFGKHTDGLMRDELMAKLGIAR